VRNRSPLDARTVSIRVTLRGPASFVSVRGAARCTGRAVRICRVAELPAGAAGSIDATLLVRRAGTIGLSAVVTSAGTEANAANNRARATIRARRR
jgi:Domain of unknown function DUF11